LIWEIARLFNSWAAHITPNLMGTGRFGLAMVEKSNSYVFGPFELIQDRGVLTCDGVALPLGSRAIRILVLLVKRAGQVVSAQELMEHVWPNGAVVESNLRVHLANIRKHLVAATGDTSAILTIPGQGYQFNLRVASHRTTARQRNSSSLPNLWMDLIGREDILDRLSTDIETHRFVSLVGSGGVGKTSVALALGHRAAELYEDGVVFADFTTLSSRSMLVDRLIGTLRLPPTESPTETLLLEHLRNRKSLLILDNCEHILKAAAELVEQILRTCPEVHVLITSREPLLGEGELVVQLHGLECPPIDKSPLTASEALTYPAARLFVERALASQSWFVLRDEDAPHLARLCHRLGGIPLAIELAAARVDLFDLSTLTDQLNNSLQLLTKGRRTAQERHRTLRATLDWSFRLLCEGERLLLSRLAIFQSAFDREAAVAVAGDDVITESRILDGVTSLAAKSLILTSREGQTPIYRLLESTREYALEMLGDGPATQDLHQKHALYFLDLARRLAPQNGFVTHLGLDRYRRIVNETRSAIAWAARTRSNPALVAKLVASSAYIWYQLSLLAEYREIADNALERMQGQADSARDELELLLAKSVGIYDILGAAPELHATGVRALQLAAELDDGEGTTLALSFLWRYHHAQTDYFNSFEVLDKLKLQADAGHDPTDIYSRYSTLTLLYSGRLEDARIRATRALELVQGKKMSIRGVYDYDAGSFIKASMARIRWLQGFPEQASQLAEEAVELALEARHAMSVCVVLVNGACPVKTWNRDYQSAERYISLLDDYSRAANSKFWSNHVAVYRSGLLHSDGGPTAREQQELGLKAGWGPRHWEHFAVLGQGFAPAAMVERARKDRCWWCAPEILRLEALRLLAQGGEEGFSQAEEFLCQGLSIANEHGSQMWKLRIYTSLAKLYSDDHRLPSVLQQLDATVSGFSEGFEFPDLQTAIETLRGQGVGQ
jgi:predicted ATPase/DNA-binding winged helix-turn-helix (wHTH) protein